MPVTAKIERLDKFHIQTANEDVLDVELSFHEGGEELGRKRFTLPLDTPEETVQAAVKRQLAAFSADRDRKTAAVERARVDAQLNETRERLVGSKISAGEGDDEE